MTGVQAILCNLEARLALWVSILYNRGNSEPTRARHTRMNDQDRPGKVPGISGRRMGLDVGERTVGIALSDELGWTAQPCKTLRRERLTKDLETLVGLVDQELVREVIVGIPLNMNGTEGPQARRVRAFAAALEEKVVVPVVFWDERWSTVAAERVLVEADLSRRKRKKQVDKVAAAIILQGYLDSRRC